ncbi:uncharacterized protein LOC126739385 isoform X2 [Anthonomus grandis grandis]|uniref:uncharacterized protein LOC126739385 isoform X2 n=1 Tax=Anthonomus grandis grandis TaxID=2921223 RepID=UPI002164F148|nr:uncharacterized protein LOC126739385 isoform X2 [Anthonomus grandis grandis]
MSINVTVSGNPVKIKRGKLINVDPQVEAKKEMEKRRILRLQQVRQQSKEFADKVRNKVKKEKVKQMGEIKKQDREKLNSWQNKKLLELQNEYLNVLEEIGAGHKEAEEYADENEIVEKQKQENQEIAKARGKLAKTKLQVQKNEDNYKKAMPLQHKKIVRDIENTRAALVAAMNKQKSKKCQKNKCKLKQKPKADINITIPNDSDFSEASSSDSSKHLTKIAEEEDANDSDGFCECSDSDSDFEECEHDDEKAPEESPVETNQNRDFINKLEPTKLVPPLDLDQLDSEPRRAYNEKSYRDIMEQHQKAIEEFRNRPADHKFVPPADTRISDRIRQRQLMGFQPDYCDIVSEPFVEPQASNNNFTSERFTYVPSKATTNNTNNGECICTKFHKSCPCMPKSDENKVTAAVQTDDGIGYKPSCKCGPKKDFKTKRKSAFESGDSQIRSDTFAIQKSIGKPSSKEIPAKPPVRLKDMETMTSSKSVGKIKDIESKLLKQQSGESSRIRHYDFPNRFEKETASTSQVERLGPESVEAIPDTNSEAEWHENMKKRDKEAQMRGRKAMEKQRVQREYEELMQKLPMLQRKEHIAQIGSDKPRYHMSEERLREREKERQNRLENAYAKVLQPKIVTLPSRKPEIPKSNEPFEIIDGDDSRTLNLGQWEPASKPRTMFSAEEVQEIIKAFTLQKPEDRKSKLKQLLKSLKLQKEQLINEIRALPNDDSINALISDLNSFSDSDTKHKPSKGKQKKRQHEESDSSSNSIEKKGRRHKDKHSRSPRKKIKKPRVLVLQNMSTQTTPNAKDKSSSSSELLVSEKTKVTSDIVNLCKRSHTPCDCLKEKTTNQEEEEEVCKIFIKLNEEELPQVEVVKSARDSSEGAGDKKPREDRPCAKTLKEQFEPVKENLRPQEKTKRVGSRSVSTETEPIHRFKKTEKRETRKPKLPSGERSPSKRHPGTEKPFRKDQSWKEHLSKNSVSSSTSYMSPPDFSRPNTVSTDGSKQSFYNLRRKPQQRNIFGSSDLRTFLEASADQHRLSTNKNLLTYVKRLLSMSKNSVDELGVSSSDVQTPSQSVIEIETNNPLAPLQKVVDLINRKTLDLAKELNASEETPDVPPNSLANMSGESGKRTHLDNSDHVPERDSNGSSVEKTKELILAQYADVTDSCAKRIERLAAMIEQLRQEKMRMLQSPPLQEEVQVEEQEEQRCDASCGGNTMTAVPLLTPNFSDKENSTRYFEFPPSGEKSKGTNSTSSMDEEEVNRRLIEIDMSLADKLKQFREVAKPEKSPQQEGKPISQPLTSEDQLEDADQQFLERLQKLVQESHRREQEDLASQSENAATQVQFVPLLIDIPKLPILEPPSSDDMTTMLRRHHPPPSKGLMTAKKFNGNISLVPHELSTIVEADSQLSTKISPNNSKTMVGTVLSPTHEEYSETSKDSSVSKNPPNSLKSSSASPSKSNKSKSCTEDTCTSMPGSSSHSLSSSNSTSDLKSIEGMLKSIGMEWAIPTLHKTQEALALSSSSSSGELSSKKRSDVSLKDFLKKQMTSKISSSSLNKSDASPASFLKDCSDLSAIHSSARQKTSTPVLSSKSTPNSKTKDQLMFSGISDISSVRNNSGEDSRRKTTSGQPTKFQSLAGDEYSSVTE